MIARASSSGHARSRNGDRRRAAHSPRPTAHIRERATHLAHAFVAALLEELDRLRLVFLHANAVPVTLRETTAREPVVGITRDGEEARCAGFVLRDRAVALQVHRAEVR